MPNLADAATRGRLVIFAGAGVSMVPPTALPSWRDVNRIVVTSLAANAATLVGTDISDAAARILLTRHEQERLPPEYQAQVLAELLLHHYFEVLKHLDSDRPNAAHLAIALLARGGFVRAVVTTNFDRTLEAAFQAVGAPLERHFRPEHFQALAGDLDRFARPGDPCQLLKLHGSVDDPTSLIDTLAQRKRGFPVAVTESVRHLLHFGPWVFMGFSGLDLEAEPNYLALAQESGSAVGFTWLVRNGTGPRPAVLHLQQRYGDRAEIAIGDLPDWLFTLADAVSAGIRPSVAEILSGAPPPPQDTISTLERGAADWARGLSPDVCAMALARLVTVSSEPQTAAALLETVLDAVEKTRRPKEKPGSRYQFVKAAASNALGCVLAGMGRHEEATVWLKSAVDLSRTAGDDESGDNFSLNLAASMEVLGEVKAARALYQSALAGFRSRHNPLTIAHGLGSLTQHLIRQGELSEAHEAATESLQQAAVAGDEPLRASGLLNLGMIARLRQEYDVALEQFAECEQISRRLGSDDGVAASLGNRADTLFAMGRETEAEELYKAAVAVNERIGRQESKAVTLMSLGRLARAAGDRASAQRYFTEALEIFRIVKDPSQEAMALYGLACLEADAGRFEEALALDHEALPLLAERNRSFRAQVLCHIGLANMKLGWVVRAESAYREAHDIAGALDNAPLRALCAQNLGLSFMLQTRDAEAAQAFGEAAALSQRLGNAAELENARLGESTMLLEQKIAAMSDAAHRLPDIAQQQEAAREMVALYPDLIERYQKLGAEQRAAHSLFSEASTWQFLSQIARAVEAYRQVAMDYRRLGLDADRNEALRRCERLLQLQTNAYLQGPPTEKAVPWLLRLAEVSGELGHLELYTSASLNAAAAILNTGTGLDHARELAQIAYDQLEPDSDKAQRALAIIQTCNDRMGV